MSEAEEPSYYEIALNSRQVLIAFIILLGGVVASFLSGAWIGREATLRGQAPLEAVEAVEGVEAEAASDAVQAADGGGPTASDDEYKFFESTDSPQVTAKAPPKAPSSPEDEALPETNRSSPTGGNPEAADSSDAGASPPVTLAKLTPIGKPEPKKAADAVARAQPPPAKQAAVAEPRSREPAQIASEPATQDEGRSSPDNRREQRGQVEPPRRSDLFVIQVFSSPDEAQARVLLDRLLNGGFKAFLSPVPMEGRTMHRVRVGPFPARAHANEVAQSLKRRYQVDTWITH